MDHCSKRYLKTPLLRLKHWNHCKRTLPSIAYMISQRFLQVAIGMTLISGPYVRNDSQPFSYSQRLVSLKNPATVVDTIFRSMQHPSQFVSRSAIRLLAILIKKSGGSLLTQLEDMGMLQLLAGFLPLPHPKGTHQEVTTTKPARNVIVTPYP